MTGTFIFVCDRGFVVVGEAKLHDMAMFWHLPVSRTVRKWGTTKGLAELKNGPTPTTIVDEACERSLPFRSVIDIIHLTDRGVREWKKILNQKEKV